MIYPNFSKVYKLTKYENSFEMYFIHVYIYMSYFKLFKWHEMTVHREKGQSSSCSFFSNLQFSLFSGEKILVTCVKDNNINGTPEK